MIRYDQLGSGKSDHPTDTTLFTVERAVQELQALRDSLGLGEVHLYGRSWGAMLVEAYMGTNPVGVRSVTLSSPLVTTAQWEQDADSLLETLPDSVQEVIARHEAEHTTDAPEYQAAAAEYYKLYLTRQPRRSKADADSARLSRGALVYNYMWGPSEFTATGTLKHFDATGWLRNLKVPTLFVTGEFDEATPASTERFSKLVAGAEFKIVPNSGHSTENDNPEALLRTVGGFSSARRGTKEVSQLVGPTCRPSKPQAVWAVSFLALNPIDAGHASTPWRCPSGQGTSPSGLMDS